MFYNEGGILEEEEYKKMYLLEDEYWWFVAKRELIKKYIEQGKNLLFLDIGCGTGANLAYLNPNGVNIGLDYSELALKFSKKRGHKNLVWGSVLKIPFRDNSFDIVGCFDLLYHKNVKDEFDALKEVYRVCKKGGQLIVTDSAFKCLKSGHDKAVHGRTRFSLEELASKIRKAGFLVEKQNYFNFFLFPIVFCFRKLNPFSKSNSSDINVTNPILNKLLLSALRFEILLSKRVCFPFGVSIFFVARK